jgi:hypothetical protein
MPIYAENSDSYLIILYLGSIKELGRSQLCSSK